MSLEDTISANTQALRELADVMRNNHTMSKTDSATEIAVMAEKMAAAVASKKHKKVEAPIKEGAPEAEASKTEQQTTLETLTAINAPTAINYDKEVKPLINKLVPINKPKAIEILAKYGATRGPELKESDYADAKADFEAALKTEDSLD